MFAIICLALMACLYMFGVKKETTEKILSETKQKVFAFWKKHSKTIAWLLAGLISFAVIYCTFVFNGKYWYCILLALCFMFTMIAIYFDASSRPEKVGDDLDETKKTYALGFYTAGISCLLLFLMVLCFKSLLNLLS